jgi:hypothetical protein
MTVHSDVAPGGVTVQRREFEALSPLRREVIVMLLEGVARGEVAGERRHRAERLERAAYDVQRCRGLARPQRRLRSDDPTAGHKPPLTRARRPSFARGSFALAGVSLQPIRSRAGHEDVETTLCYVKIAEGVRGNVRARFPALPASQCSRMIRRESSWGRVRSAPPQANASTALAEALAEALARAAEAGRLTSSRSWLASSRHVGLPP